MADLITCPVCDGLGFVPDEDGDPTDCLACGGSGSVDSEEV